VDRSAKKERFPLGHDITLEELDRDPYPAFARLRLREPISWLPALDMWFVVGYENVRDALLDSARLTTASPQSTIFDTFGEHVLTSEGAAHERYRQAVTAAPIGSGAEAGRSDVADAIDQAAAIVGEQDNRAAGEAGDVAGSAGAGETLHFVVTMAPGGIEISEAVNFGGAEEADVDASLLQEIHDVEHLAALGSAEDVRRVAHGVKQLGGGSLTNDAVFEQANRAGSMGAASDEKGEHGKAHADEDDFAIVNFARGGGHHQFAEGVGACGGFGFLAMGQIGRDLDKDSNIRSGEGLLDHTAATASGAKAHSPSRLLRRD